MAHTQLGPSYYTIYYSDYHHYRQLILLLILYKPYQTQLLRYNNKQSL